MDLRAACAELGAMQPKGHAIFSEAGTGWNVRWRASSQAQNPVKSPRQDFSTFLTPVRVPQYRRVVLLRDTVRCHFRFAFSAAIKLYPPVFM